MGAAAALFAAIAIGFVVPGSAGAATPTDICRAIAAGTFNAANYTQAELNAYQTALTSDATIQGYCSPLPIVPPPTTTTATSVCAEGQTQSTGPNGEVVCTSGTTTVTTPQTTAGVLPATHTTTTGVKGTTKVKAAPTAAPRQASPLGTTRSSGTLPFTGAELSVFAIVGLALIGGGLLLRATARHKRSSL